MEDKYHNLHQSKYLIIGILILSALILILPLTVFLSQKPVKTKSKAAEANVTPIPKYKGYIVQFKDSVPATGSARAGARNSVIKGKPVKAEFNRAFNGIALEISDTEAQALKKSSPYVKEVYPNLEVKANLMDSVPLIGANPVWNLVDSKNLPVDGRGINVAVIDTGVDYTHRDLGETVPYERPLTKVSRGNITAANGIKLDHIIAIHDGIIAYPHDKSIFLDAIDGSSHQEIPLYKSSLTVGRIAYDGRILAYFADDQITPTRFVPIIYAYDLQTKVHKQITDDIHYISALDVSEGYVFYSIEKLSEAYVNGTYGTGIYATDFATGQEKTIDSWKIFESINSEMRVDGHLLAYNYGGGSDNCYSKTIVYNLKTSTKNEYQPPELSILLDMHGSKIIYAGCNNMDKYYLFDYSTNVSNLLVYDPQSTADLSSNNEKSRIEKQAYWFGNNGFSASIQDNIIFFNKDHLGNQIVAYTPGNDKYTLINTSNISGDFTADGNMVCFVGIADAHIYCHTYNPASDYSIQKNIFNQKVVDGYNFINNTSDPQDDNGHGTHVASIIGGSGALDGAAKGANIIAYKALDSSGTGYYSNIILAIEKAIGTRQDDIPSNDIGIINLSLGVDCKYYYGNYVEYCGPDDPLAQAVDRATAAGISVIVAAGNTGATGASSINSPGVARTAITVGAVDKYKETAYFSSVGPVIWNGADLHKPDIVAPGENICACRSNFGNAGYTCFDNTHVYLSGTSMATPHVAGVVALITQMYPGWSPAQIKQKLIASAENLHYNANSQGAGLVSAYRSFDIAPTITPSPTPTATPTPTPLLTRIPAPPVFKGFSADFSANMTEPDSTYLAIDKSNPPTGLFTIQNPFTVEAWVKVPKPVSSNYYYINSIVTLTNPPPLHNRGYAFGLLLETEVTTGNSKASFSILGANTPGYFEARSKNTIIPVDTWAHIAATSVSEGNSCVLTIFVNGKQAGSTKAKYSNCQLDNVGVEKLVIGKPPISPGGDFGDYLSGEVDNIRISNNKRYSSDFSPPIGPFVTDTNTVALWQFDTSRQCNAANVCYAVDSSANGYHARIYGNLKLGNPLITPPLSPIPNPPTLTPTVFLSKPTATKIPLPTITKTIPKPTATKIPLKPTITKTPPKPTATKILIPTATKVPPIPTATKIIPKPTATKIPITNMAANDIASICECQNNVCAASCIVNSSSNRISGFAYTQPMRCDRQVAVSGPIPSAANKNSFCQRPYRTKGDANGDGIVNETDFTIYLRAVLGAPIAAADDPDFNGDGIVSPADLAIYMYTILGRR